MQMEIMVFAILKEYFPMRFTVRKDIADVEGLRLHLQDQQPAAAELLRICRFAKGDRFLDDSSVLQPSDIVCILPPGSGG
jgi:molybdopterin synthase sulfur carrier subunit